VLLPGKGGRGFTIQEDGALLLFMDRGTVAIWQNGALTEILSELEAEKSSRFNDVLADPRGRVFCGTMSSSEGKGRLYRLDNDGSCHVLLEDIGCSNGMAFSMDLKSFYYTDSFAHAIYLFDYNIEDGAISNQRVFAQFEPNLGFPDGATLDSEGRLWSAIWDGSCIVRLDSNGFIETKVALPARKVSSLIFADPDLSDLYITTAGGNNKAEEGRLAGALFRIKTSVHGLPGFHSRIAVPAKT
jgi:D-xylono/L-arabinono-1,4-lactonase